MTKINPKLPRTPQQVCLPPHHPATTREGGGTATPFLVLVIFESRMASTVYRSYRADQQPDQTNPLKNNCKIHLLHAPTKSVWAPESTTVTWQQQNIAKIANHWLILRPTKDP